MDVAGAALLRRFENALDVQVAVARSGSADPVGLVAGADMLRAAIGIGVNSDGRKAQGPAGACHADRDLAAVGDQDRCTSRHSGMFPCFLAGPRSRLPS